VTGWWFAPGTLVSSTNKAYRHDIAEILLKVVLNTITVTPCCVEETKDFTLKYASIQVIWVKLS